MTMRTSSVTQARKTSSLPEVTQLALREALVLEAVTDGAWRVCDNRITRGGGRFLAFLEAKADRFEVMQLADGFVWTTFDTIEAALEHVALTNSDRIRSDWATELAWLQ